MSPDPIIPNETRSDAEHARAHHLDLDTLDPERAWAEHLLVRMELARMIWHRRRRLQTVRRDGHHVVDEKQWCVERLAHLDRLLARRKAVA